MTNVRRRSRTAAAAKGDRDESMCNKLKIVKRFIGYFSRLVRDDAYHQAIPALPAVVPYEM